jgi:hypothetical protein
MRIFHQENFPRYHGKVICHMTDAKTGETQLYWEKDNIVTRDAGIQMARLMADNTEPNFGAYMLAVGTGATGAVLAPDAPDDRQRKLNAELERKSFSSVTFRDASGNAVAYYTNIVDFTTNFSEAEAVGPLNEMGIISPISSNPSTTNPNPNSFPTYDTTVDVSLYDVLLNYLTYSVISKPSGSNLAFTWRFTF